MSNNEQNNNNKFYLVLCELHYTSYHGKTNNSFTFIEGHYLLLEKIDPNNIYNYSEKYIEQEQDNDDDNYDYNSEEYNINIEILSYRYIYQLREEILHNIQLLPHPIIRNYFSIIDNPYYIKPEIAQCITLDSGETIVILKTFWLRIIQRKWKKIYKKRVEIIRQRLLPKSLSYREYNSKWPSRLNNLPSIYKMFYSI
jgi:hypothetical protein